MTLAPRANASRTADRPDFLDVGSVRVRVRGGGEREGEDDSTTMDAVRRREDDENQVLGGKDG